MPGTGSRRRACASRPGATISLPTARRQERRSSNRDLPHALEIAEKTQITLKLRSILPGRRTQAPSHRRPVPTICLLGTARCAVLGHVSDLAQPQRSKQTQMLHSASFSNTALPRGTRSSIMHPRRSRQAPRRDEHGCASPAAGAGVGGYQVLGGRVCERFH